VTHSGPSVPGNGMAQAAVLSLRCTMVIIARLCRANKETPPPVCRRGSLGDDKQQSQEEEEIDLTSQERILIRSILWIASYGGAPYHLS
jgi:hypothetical protein